MIQWVKDAIADGWLAEPTYKGEDIDNATRLMKEGFIVLAIDRVEKKQPWGITPAQQSVHVWGPDGLAIDPPETYSMEELKRKLRICGYCGKEGPTKRIGFAGRTCDECHAKNVSRIEYPGWTN